MTPTLLSSGRRWRLPTRLFSLLTSILLLGLGQSNAQTPAWLQVVAPTFERGNVPTGTQPQSSIRATATDASGNVYVTGTVSGKVTFKPGLVVETASGAQQAMFVGKWNTAAGTWDWVVRNGGTNTISGFGIAVANSKVYVTGYFYTSATIAGQPLTSAGTVPTYDMFLAAFDAANGNGLWAVSAGGDYSYGSSTDAGVGVAVSGTNIYVAGYFANTATFGPGKSLTTAGSVAGTNNSFSDAFLAKYTDNTNSATCAWVTQAGGASEERYNSIALSGSTIYVGGYYNSAFSVGSSTLPTPTGADGLVAKYTDGSSAPTGNWAANISSTGTDQVRGVAAGTNCVYVAGYLGASTGTAGAASGPSKALSGSSTQNVVLARYSAAGAVDWAVSNTAAGGTNQALSLAATGTSLYLGGTFSTSMTLAGSPLTSTGQTDIFLAKFTDGGSSATGNWALSGGSSNSDLTNAVAAAGNAAWVGGYIGQQGTFGSLTAGTNDAFLQLVLVRGGTNTATITVPVVSTATPASVGGGGATLGGDVTGGGGATVTERGVVYSSTSSSPTLGATGVTTNTNGSGTGSFTENITGLTAGTTYYVAAYATNSAGTGYGTTLSFTTTPNAPTISTPASGAFTNDNTPTYSGAAAPGGTVTVYVRPTGGSFASIGTATANGSGAWTLTQPSALPAGSTQVYATVTVGSSAVSASSATTTFTIDTTAPTATISRQSPAATATNATSLTFRVQFNETVTGVTTGSFALNVTGTSGSIASVTAVNGVSNAYDVTVNSVSGNGTLGISLKSSGSGVTDPAGNAAPGVTGPTYTIDQTAPTVTLNSTNGASGSSTTTTPLSFTATFSEPVTGLGSSDIAVTNGTVSSGPTTTGVNTYTFQVTPTTPNTATTVQVLAGAAQDGVGNGNTASASYSLTYTLPTVQSITGLTPTPTATSTVSYRVVFSAAVSGLTTSNFNLTTSGLSGTGVNSVSGSGTTYTVEVNTGSGNGTLRLNVQTSAGVTPGIAGLPTTSGTTYDLIRSFAAAPQLLLQGQGAGGNDVTAFVDQVQVVQSGTSTLIANALQNGSFENNNVNSGDFRYAGAAVAAPWTLGPQAGIARNGSAFGAATPPDGDAVALLQSTSSNNGSIAQNLAVPTGTYQVTFLTAQRNCCAAGSQQAVNVYLREGASQVFIGAVQPTSTTAYQLFTSAAFSVTAPALTATVSSSASPTARLTPIPFAVSFSQSVGTSFAASDLTVTGGTFTSGSFAGSGAGPYTFTVTPNAPGATVAVSVAAGVVQDANNTRNTASNLLSVLYQPTSRVAGTALRFTGEATAGYVSFGGSATPAPQFSGAYTQMVWLKRSGGSGSAMYYALGNGTTGSGAAPFIYVTGNGRVGAGYGYGGGLRTAEYNSSAIDAGKWYHVAAVYNGSTLTVYLDGVAVASTNTTDAPTGGRVNFVGSAGTTGSSYFPGDLDEVSQWNTALTQTQIRLRRHLTLTGTEANLVSYLQCNDAGGTTTDVISGAVGTLTGAVSRQTSTAAVGYGTSNPQTVTTSTTYTFTGTNVSISFTNVSGSSETVVSRLEGEPLGTQPSTAGLRGIYKPAYWVVDKYPTGTFTTANVTYTLSPVDISPTDAASPSTTLRLFKRGSNDDGTFSEVIAATAANAAAGTITFPVTSFSQTVIGTLGTSPLPVTLLRFTAERQGEAALLRWTTAQEKNNAYFEVESSVDGREFRAIGRVPGHGTSTTRHDYQLPDAQLLGYGAGTVYYRLRQVDYDGTATLSDVVALAVDAGSSAAKLQLLPNPAHAQVRVLGAVGPLELLDLTGRVVRRQADAGLVPLTGLPAGVYVVRNGTRTARLVVE